MREIVLDTETTGMDPDKGDRMIEIGCVELINHIPTGKHLQLYINPERDVPADATAVHGITNEFLEDKPVFSQVYSEFLDFIGADAKLVIHNAEFDMKFINAELKTVGHTALPWSRVIDTLAIARRKFPGSPANLDALCRRFGIDNTERTYHGALLDSELLAEVYLELLGGRQRGLTLGSKEDSGAQDSGGGGKGGGMIAPAERKQREKRAHAPTEEELAAHKEMLDKLSNPIWKKSA
jgi:DNA polymerase-3 subunit epsilon